MKDSYHETRNFRIIIMSIVSASRTKIITNVCGRISVTSAMDVLGTFQALPAEFTRCTPHCLATHWTTGHYTFLSLLITFVTYSIVEMPSTGRATSRNIRATVFAFATGLQEDHGQYE